METIWTDEVTLGRREPLQGDIETEVVIIGAGLAGILTGYMLKENGIPAVILEADRIAGGQTRGTTAKITSQHNMIYDEIIRMYGLEKARHFAGFHEWAIGAYERIIKKEKIDCNFERCTANLYSCAETERLQREAAAAVRAGIRANYKTECELPFAVKSVLEFENQAKFHPLKFIKKLAEELQIFEKTRAVKVRTICADGKGQTKSMQRKNCVITDRGSVTADKVVFACHFPFINIPGYYFARMHQSRSYVAAFRNAGRLSGYYLGIDEDGYSFRNEGELLLVGGGNHRTGYNKSVGKYQEAADKAKELWPDCEEVYRWSAQDCMTLDHIPYIGSFSQRENGWYVATGFGKWGMTSSMTGARIITSHILGMEVPEADVFSPQRKLSASGVGNLMKNQAVAVKNLVSCRETKRCTHLGCKLSWNADEGTWDCPCHGSRFDREGGVLAGPAVHNLS